MAAAFDRGQAVPHLELRRRRGQVGNSHDDVVELDAQAGGPFR
jgi:hypothetical protein